MYTSLIYICPDHISLSQIPLNARRVIYHTSTGQYIGVATFFFFYYEPGLKLIEDGLGGQKCSVGCLFRGWLPPP